MTAVCISHIPNSEKMEAAPGLEPGNEGFADPCLSLLAMPPKESDASFGFEFRFAGRAMQEKRPITIMVCPRLFRTNLNLPFGLQIVWIYLTNAPENSQNIKKWSGKRDSDPRPSAWQADALTN